MRDLIAVSGTVEIEQHWKSLHPLKKNTKRLWLMLLMIYQDISILLSLTLPVLDTEGNPKQPLE